jgi:phage tail sheath gpL-like
MPQNNISIAQARGNFLTWCISGYLPLEQLCKPIYFAQQLSTADGGTGVPGTWYEFYSVNDVRDTFGPGCPLTLMAMQHFATCPELPLYCSPLAEVTTGAVKATHTITITGPATGTGLLAVALMDFEFEVAVNTGTTGDAIAAALADAFNANVDLPFDAAAATGGQITMTSKVVGAAGNWFEPIWNPEFGDQFPPGVAVTTAAGTPGNATYDAVTLVTPFQCPWDCVAIGVEDEIVVNTVIHQLRAQWLCGVQGDFRGGECFHSYTDTAGQIAAYGRDRNNPEEVVIPVRTGYKYPGYLFSAATCSRVCCTACDDPSRPVQYDNGILGSLYDHRQCSTVWSSDEKKMFYDAGIMNWDVANSLGVRVTSLWIEEPLTTYKYDQNTGAPDGAWQRVESRYTVMKFARDLGFWYRHNWSSVSLVDDGTRIPPGKRAVSPRIMKASILAWMRAQEIGWTIEDAGRLESMVAVERTETPNNCDPNRLNVMLDIDLVNQLARIATTIQQSPQWSCIPPVAIPAQIGG